MPKACLIRQPAGLGDIILCHKIANVFVSKGYDVYWPVIDDYLMVANKYFNTTAINYCSVNGDYPLKNWFNSGRKIPAILGNGDVYLPLQYADLQYPGQSVLESKFKILGTTHSNWQQDFSFNRDQQKEDKLFYDVLGLKDEDNYLFCNMWYGSPPNQVLKDEINIDRGDVINMSFVDGYTIFDWCKVIENAKEIHCVDTGLFYIIEYLDLKCSKLEAYSKFDPPDYRHIENIFQKSWSYN